MDLPFVNGSVRSVEARDRTLPDWFTRIRTGQIRLPRFQRYESWNHNIIGNLLETVVQGLPAGAALVLEVGDREQFISRAAVGAPDLDVKPNEHLLDGQQRLTALWRAFHDDYEERTYFVYFEDQGEGQEPRIRGIARSQGNGSRRPLWADKPSGIWSRGYVPLRLLRPGEFGNEIKEWCRAAVPDDLEASHELELKIHELRHRVAQYNIPFLELDASTPQDVAIDVFIKMNTSYVQLTAFDIIVAQFEEATGESLHDLVTELLGRVPDLKLYMEPSDLILEVAALREDRPPTQASYQRLDLTQLFDAWSEITDGISSATEFLEQERIFDGERLPTVAVVRVLAALHPFVSTAPDELGNARRLLRKYLWRAFLTGRYEAAAATASFQDFRALRRVLQSEAEEKEVPVFDEDQYPIPTADTFRSARWPKSRDSLARAVLNVSIAAGAHDVADDAPATRDHLQKREYHHLFPAALLEKAGAPSWEIYKGLNCALITWKTNRTIGAQEPLKYLRERVRRNDLGEAEIKRRLATHYIPFEELAVGGYEGVGEDASVNERVLSDYARFITRRAELLVEPINALCDGRHLPPTEVS